MRNASATAVLDRLQATPETPAPPPGECACGVTLEPTAAWGQWRVPAQCEPCRLAAEIGGHWDREAERRRRRPAERPRFDIPARYAAVTVDGYRCPPGDARAREAVRRWEPASGAGLYMHGPTGSGKTHLAFAIARTLVAQRRPVDRPGAWPIGVEPDMRPAVSDRLRRRYPDGHPYDRLDVQAATVPAILAAARARFTRGKSADDILDALSTCDVLVLDDLGAERATEWAREQLFLVIDERLNAMRPTVITSNLTIGQLAGRYGDADGFPAGERLASRLVGSCDVVAVQAEDYRVTGGAR